MQSEASFSSLLLSENLNRMLAVLQPSPSPSLSLWEPPGLVDRQRWRAYSWSGTALWASEQEDKQKVGLTFLLTNQNNKSRSFGTFRSLLRPIMAVGVKANDRKCERGNQNQNWVKTSSPTTDDIWVWPVLDCREMVILRPPGQHKDGRATECQFLLRNRPKLIFKEMFKSVRVKSYMY